MLLTKQDARKRIHNGCSVRIENFVTRDNCSASRGKPRDAEQLNRDGIFNPHLTTIKDSYKPHPFVVLGRMWNSINQF